MSQPVHIVLASDDNDMETRREEDGTRYYGDIWSLTSRSSLREGGLSPKHGQNTTFKLCSGLSFIIIENETLALINQSINSSTG